MGGSPVHKRAYSEKRGIHLVKSSLLEIMHEKMKSDQDFCEKVLKQKVSVEYGCYKEEKKYKVPCELFELPTLHLTMKYNDDIFKRMLQLAFSVPINCNFALQFAKDHVQRKSDG